jgi:cytochrome c553
VKIQLKHLGGALLGLCVATQALAAFEGGDPKAGAEKSALCQGCHGPDGNSVAGDFPRLAGQYSGYIVKQIRDFQAGHRANNEIMAGMAGTVASVEDAKDIASYFASQKVAKDPIVPPDQKLVKVGEKLFTEGNPTAGVYGCINCHGARGSGKAENISQFPRISSQHRDYIIKQLKDFRDGRRTNDPAGMMGDIAKKLSDSEIQAVAEYLAAQLR